MAVAGFSPPRLKPAVTRMSPMKMKAAHSALKPLIAGYQRLQGISDCGVSATAVLLPERVRWLS